MSGSLLSSKRSFGGGSRSTPSATSAPQFDEDAADNLDNIGLHQTMGPSPQRNAVSAPQPQSVFVTDMSAAVARSSTVIGDTRAENAQLKNENAALLREIQRLKESQRLEQEQYRAEINRLQALADAAQAAAATHQADQYRSSRDKTESVKTVEELKSENERLRRDLASSLDVKFQHLRTPMVPLEQYQELLALAEQYAVALGGGGSIDKGMVPSHLYNNMQTTSRVPAAISAAPSQPGLQRTSSSSQVLETSTSKGPSGSTLRSAVMDPLSRGASLQQGQQPSLGSTFVGTGLLGTARTLSEGPTSLPPVVAPPPQVREPIVDGGKLVKIIQDLPTNGSGPSASTNKMWSFQNCTNDTQFILEFTFGPQCEIVPIGQTRVEGRTYSLSVYPGETKPFIRGHVNGFKMAIRYGPPDSSYVPPSSVTDAELQPVVERVRGLNCYSNVEDLLRMCASQGIPFVDLDFPPLSQSMCRSHEGQGPPVRWERPVKFLPVGVKEELCTSGFDHLGPVLGTLNDPWIVSALSIAGAHRIDVLRAFSRSLQSPGEQIAGCYRVQLLFRGLWRNITMDTFFPCCVQSTSAGGNSLVLFGVRNRDPRDLWAPLMEKAFAKVHGSYAAISFGDTFEALSDIIGAPFERFDWRQKDHGGVFSNILRRVQENKENIAIVTSAPPTDAAVAEAAKRKAEGGTTAPTTTSVEGLDARSKIESIGFLVGHAYQILACVNVEEFKLCFICNPHGGTTSESWSGTWSSKSEMWLRHPKVKEACTQATANLSSSLLVGAVWMDWRDVKFYFDGCGVLKPRRDWLDIRIGNRFFGTRPQWILELSVTRPTQCFIGLHQSDRRGRDASDPERTYAAFVITAVAASEAGVWDAVAQSHSGTFWRGRDVHLELNLIPKDKAYYIIPRRYSAEGDKVATLSLQIEHRDAVSIALKQPTEELMTSVKYSPVWKFDPGPCGPAPVPLGQCQINREDVQALRW